MWVLASGLWGLFLALSHPLSDSKIHPYFQQLAEHIRSGFIWSPAIFHAGRDGFRRVPDSASSRC